MIREYEATSRSSAFYVRSDRAFTEVGGADRAKFLHGMLTNDIVKLATGRWVWASMLNTKGRVLYDVAIYNLGEVLWLESDAARRSELETTLKKYVLRAAVTFADRSSDLSSLTLVGPDVGKVFMTLFGEPVPGEGEVKQVSAGSVTAALAPLPMPLSVTMTAIPTKVDEIRSRLRSEQIQELSTPLREALRIEAGIPQYGIDVSEEHLLLEVPFLARGVSYTKGCYVGQETVARLHARGENVARRLMGIRSKGQNLLGASVMHNGQSVGRITSACESPRLGVQLGLALIHREAFEPGTEVTLSTPSGDVSGVVVSLPLS